MNLLSLVMILKNESASIRSVLECAYPYVDHWTILDTGSTDSTQDIVREVMMGKPGELFEESFIDFATARNRVMELDATTHPCEFQLMLSGDEYLIGGTSLRTYLEEHREQSPPIHCHWLKLTIRGVVMMTPRIFRTGSAWKYEGKVHECPFNRLDPNSPQSFVTGAEINHVESDPEARLDSIEALHIPLLKKELEENPNNERALVFLAQSYKTLIPYLEDEEERKSFAMEALSLWHKRLDIPTGTDAERNFIHMHILDTARTLGLFEAKELYEYALWMCLKDPARPETALLRAELSIQFIPLHEVYSHAVHAAKIAHEAKKIQNISPIDTSCEWKAHRLAMVAARQIQTKRPKTTIDGRTMPDVLKYHYAEAMKAGGPWELFQQLLNTEYVEAAEKKTA